MSTGSAVDCAASLLNDDIDVFGPEQSHDQTSNLGSIGMGALAKEPRTDRLKRRAKDGVRGGRPSLHIEAASFDAVVDRLADDSAHTGSEVGTHGRQAHEGSG